MNTIDNYDPDLLNFGGMRLGEGEAVERLGGGNETIDGYYGDSEKEAFSSFVTQLLKQWVNSVYRIFHAYNGDPFNMHWSFYRLMDEINHPTFPVWLNDGERRVEELRSEAEERRLSETKLSVDVNMVYLTVCQDVVGNLINSICDALKLVVLNVHYSILSSQIDLAISVATANYQQLLSTSGYDNYRNRDVLLSLAEGELNEYLQNKAMLGQICGESCGCGDGCGH